MGTADTAATAEAVAETQDLRQHSASAASGPADPIASPAAEPLPARPGAPLDSALAPSHEPLLAAIEAAAEKVLAAFHHQFSVNDHRTRQVDTLHAELTKHRDDLLGRALAPMVKSFVQLHDEMGRAIDRLASKPETEILKEDAMRVLEDFQEEVALALARNDVETYSENNVGHDFDGRRQTVIDHKDAETDEQAGKVAVCLRPGFQSQGVILQKERVVIYRKPVAKQGA